MGEGARKSRAKAQVLANEERCIYCDTANSPDAKLTLEHMPPIAMFRGRDRVSGMEFACCETCNVKTRGADIAASCLSLIPRRNLEGDWKTEAMVRLLPALDRYAPGVRAEMVRSKQKRRWLWTPQGLIEPHVELEADGPILAAHLSVFAAKLAMALYREHIGEPLPLDGAVYTTHFLNSGLNQAQADAMLGIMPIAGQLQQGRKSSAGQFEYRYNCDNRTIIAALASLHHNLHVLLFATSDPSTYGVVADMPHMWTTRPGGLVDRLDGM